MANVLNRTDHKKWGRWPAKLKLSQQEVATCKYINNQSLTICVWLEKKLAWKKCGWQRTVKWNKDPKTKP